ncbi:MAG: hypothetical protein AAF639_03920 [Chloroflexota bacterium]
MDQKQRQDEQIPTLSGEIVSPQQPRGNPNIYFMDDFDIDDEPFDPPRRTRRKIYTIIMITLSILLALILILQPLMTIARLNNWTEWQFFQLYDAQRAHIELWVSLL